VFAPKLKRTVRGVEERREEEGCTVCVRGAVRVVIGETYRLCWGIGERVGRMGEKLVIEEEEIFCLEGVEEEEERLNDGDEDGVVEGDNVASFVVCYRYLSVYLWID